MKGLITGPLPAMWHTVKASFNLISPPGLFFGPPSPRRLRGAGSTGSWKSGKLSEFQQPNIRKKKREKKEEKKEKEYFFHDQLKGRQVQYSYGLYYTTEFFPFIKIGKQIFRNRSCTPQSCISEGFQLMSMMIRAN